jgi:hypothetical protein
MTNKELLLIKIQSSKEELAKLEKKQQNLQLNIDRLRMKIRNQEFQLEHIKVEKEIQVKDQTNVGESSNIEDQILSQLK